MLQPAAAALAGEAGRLCENLFRHSGFYALLLSRPICILHKIKCCCRRCRSPPGLPRTCSSDRVVLHLGMLSGQRFYVNANNMMSSMLHRLISSVLILAHSLIIIQCTSGFGFTEQFNKNNKGSTSALSKIPIVICPGFGNDQIDYLNPLNQGEEYGFVKALARRGFEPDLIRVLPLKRYEWIRVAGGLFDIPNFYTGTCLPEGLGYGWYVKRLRKTIEEAYVNAGRGEKVILIGHSAGGWLARAALGDGTWNVEDDTIATGDARAADRVRALVTIGAIHKPPAGDAASTCVTRGALSYLDQMYPGAYHSKEGIAYVSVGGKAIIGKKELKQQSTRVDDRAQTMEGTQEVNDIYLLLLSGIKSSK